MLEFVFEGALALAGSAGQQILAIFRRVGAVFSLIVADPLKFLGNLLSAVKGGFGKFKDNIVAHLRTGLFEWLLGSLEGVTLPKTWDFAGILHLVLQVLGLTYTALRAVLVKLIGEPAVAAVEKVFDFLVLVVTKGLGAAWDKIKEFATDLADQVVSGIRDWVTKSVVGAAVTKLVTMFNPVGAIIQGIITIYNTVMFFIERAQQIARLVNAVMDSVETIARGNLSAAVAYVERTMANTLPVILGFLSRLLGLGNVTKYVRDIITKIRTTIAGALEKAGLWVKDKVKALLAAKKASDKEASDDVRIRAGKLVAERAKDKHNDKDIDIVVANVLQELRPAGLRSLAFESETESGDAFLVAEASPGKRVGRKTGPKIMTRTCVMRVTLQFDGNALATIEKAGGRPLLFGQRKVPQARRGDVGGPAGLIEAADIGTPPPSQGKMGLLLLKPEAATPNQAEVVSYNSGDPAYTKNESHAEAFFMEWFRHASLPGLQELDIRINLSPCTHCARILTEISDTQAPRRKLSYTQAYEGVDRKTKILRDNTTTTDDLVQLKGWQIGSPSPAPKYSDLTKREAIDRGVREYHSEGP